MKTANIVDIDREIARRWDELNSLYQKRIDLLQEEISDTQARIQTVNGGKRSVTPCGFFGDDG
jgi:hypothetical protein